MKTIVSIADMRDPDDPAGRTYRQVNAEKKHAIPIGALVEINHDDEDLESGDFRGVRLYVVFHARDCDQTPLYCLCADRNNTERENPRFYNRKWENGWSEDSLTVIKLPD